MFRFERKKSRLFPDVQVDLADELGVLRIEARRHGADLRGESVDLHACPRWVTDLDPASRGVIRMSRSRRASGGGGDLAKRGRSAGPLPSAPPRGMSSLY